MGQRAPFQIEWANPEKTILLVTLPEVWTPDDFVEARVQANALRDSVPHVVHSIIDARQSRAAPDGFLASFTRINQLEHERTGHSIWVAAEASLFTMRLMEIYKRVFGFEIPIVYSLDAAFQYIAGHPL